jgi:hypothetical protein
VKLGSIEGLARHCCPHWCTSAGAGVDADASVAGTGTTIGMRSTPQLLSVSAMMTHPWSLVVSLVVFLLFAGAPCAHANICPNGCSGHGECNARWLRGECACFDGWKGALDCSLSKL